MIVAVLGRQLEGPFPDTDLRGRVDVGIDVFRGTDASHLVFSGGQTNPDVPRTESEVMAEYAQGQGVQRNDIIIETDARDTIGNGYFVRRLIENMRDEVAEVQVVTTGFHADRARYVFERCFGEAVEIRVDRCYDAGGSPPEHDETKRLEQTKAFFEPVSVGDVEAIRRRFADAHVYYEWLAAAESRFDQSTASHSET